MQAFRKTSHLAPRPHATIGASGHQDQSPRENPSATSGAYFRAVRPTPAEADAVARGEPHADCAKVEGLRFELEVGVWRGDSALIARRVVADAECVSDADADGE
jgi:hypothetical protein